MLSLTIIIIGGDERQRWLARLLAAEGHRVTTVGLGETAYAGDLYEGAEAAILPLPALNPAGAVRTPLEFGALLPETVAAAVGETPVFAGKLPPEVAALFRGGCTDYFARESLTLRNAELTAEGALQLLLEELPRSLLGLRVLILGAGRIGGLLARMLLALGAEVTVAARREEERTRMRLLGCRAVTTEALEEAVAGQEALVNTVPARLLTPQVLDHINKDALLLDLASAPGGFSLGDTAQRGLRAVKAAALPGKCAPKSAAEAIRDTLTGIWRERGMLHG